MKRSMLTILLTIGVLFSLLADNSYVQVKFGERPTIDLNNVPENAYKKGFIQIKLNDSKVIAEIEESEKELGIKAALEIAFPQLHSLNLKFEIVEVSKIFDIPALRNEYVDRHKKWGLHRWYRLHFSTKNNVIAMVKQYNELSEIFIAEPVYKKRIIESIETTSLIIPEKSQKDRWTPDDTYFDLQWHYHNTGQDAYDGAGTVDADIDLVEAWELETGNPDVIVAIVDEGIQYDHPDIAGNMWNNIGPNGTSTPAGDHGTHVAGTVAGVTNNGVGIAGIAGGSGNNDGVRLMSINMLGENPTVDDEIGVIYAADNGAVISQNSWGYTVVNVYNQSSLDGIDYFNANAGGPGAPLDGGLTIFAAGNDGDNGNWYPGYYSGAMAVAASDHNDQIASFSNYGTWVEITAPGEGIASSSSPDTYLWMSGTSMACPHVSGVAALAVSYAPGTMTALELRNLLKDNTDDISSLNPSYSGQIGSGRLNAHKVLLALDGSPAPTAPTCEITAPNAGTTYTLGADVTISVDASDDGNITKVDFYADNNLLGSDSSQPYSYSFSTTGYNAGSLPLKAIATDDEGLSTTSTIVSITLNEETGGNTPLPYTTNFDNLDGWSQISINCSDRWALSSSNRAGGTANELKAHYERTDPATTMFVSPLFNTEGMTSLSVSFKHFFDYAKTGITIKVQSSNNGTNWTDESWVVNPTSDIGAETQLVDISNNVGAETYIAFVITGNLKNFRDWYIDDVEVTEGNSGPIPTPPTCKITAPNEGTSYIIGADVTISADATDDGTVTKVDFYANGNLLGTDSSEPYSYTFSTTGYSAGTLPLEAIATDDEGLSTTSAIVNVTLNEEGGSAPVTIFEEGFENGGNMPSGWDEIITSGSLNWTFEAGGNSSKPASANSGSYNALLYNPSTTANSSMLITPVMDLSDITDVTLDFYHAMQANRRYKDELKIYYKTSLSGSWIEIAHYTASLRSWTNQTNVLPNPSSTYYIAFEGIAKNGFGVCIDDITVSGIGTRGSNGKDFEVKEFSLQQNHPNPFNPVTNISYSLQNDSKVRIAVYNMKGETVWNSGVLNQNSGDYSISFDGSNFNSGVFYYSLTVGNKTVTKKMLLVK